MNSHAHVVADPTSDFASESDVPSVSAVADVLRDVLGAYLTTDQAVDAIRHVAVCGDRVAVHLGVTVSGAVELAELEATVAARIRDLGVTAGTYSSDDRMPHGDCLASTGGETRGPIASDWPPSGMSSQWEQARAAWARVRWP